MVARICILGWFLEGRAIVQVGRAASLIRATQSAYPYHRDPPLIPPSQPGIPGILALGGEGCLQSVLNLRLRDYGRPISPNLTVTKAVIIAYLGT